MSLWFHQLCPYYVPIRSPSFTQLCYFPNYFPSISHRVSQIYMWIYVDSHDMPILSVRAYIIPINWWLQRDSHGSQGFFSAGSVGFTSWTATSGASSRKSNSWSERRPVLVLHEVTKHGACFKDMAEQMGKFLFVKAIKMDGPFWNKLTSLGGRDLSWTNFSLEMWRDWYVLRFYCQVVKVQWRSNESWKTLREFMSEAWFVRLWCCLEKEHTLW